MQLAHMIYNLTTLANAHTRPQLAVLEEVR